MKPGSKLLSAVVLAVAVPSMSLAAEKHIPENKVPKAVIEAVKQKYPDAKMTGFEEEKEGKRTAYEVDVQSGSTEMEVDVTPEGKIISEETRIEEAALPESVKKAFAASKHGKSKVEKVEKVVVIGKEDSPSYEVAVTEGGKRNEIVFDKDGKVLHEKKAGKEPRGEAKREAEKK